LLPVQIREHCSISTERYCCICSGHSILDIKRAQDDERLDALLKDLAKRAPDVFLSVSDDTYSTGSTRSNMTGRSPTSEVAADLQKIKGAIAGMQQKLQHTQKSKKR